MGKRFRRLVLNDIHVESLKFCPFMPLWFLFFSGKYKYNLEVYALIKEVVILKLVVVKIEVAVI